MMMIKVIESLYDSTAGHDEIRPDLVNNVKYARIKPLTHVFAVLLSLGILLKLLKLTSHSII